MNALKTKAGYLQLLIFLFAGMNASQAQSLKFSFNKYINMGDTLNYRFLSPDNNSTRNYPLVIFLHGAALRGNDNEAQLKWSVMNFATDEALTLHPAFVLAPQCPEKMQWANTMRGSGNNDIYMNPEPSKPMSLLIQLIHELIKKNRIDTNRIYITGFSMGGIGTFDAIERYPDLFAAAVPVSGAGDTSKASLIAHIPIWIFHGAEDPVINPRYAINMIEMLDKAGAHPGFTLYPEVGHYAWFAAYSDPKTMEWLFRQHK
jgi:predicted peptidase